MGKPDTGSDVVAPGTLSALLQDIARQVARAPEVEPASGLKPGAVVDRFEIVREVGRGGFGIVYEARDSKLDRTVAFKVVRAGSRPEVREERLLREAEAAARLSHPNIVTLFDVGRCEQGPYLVLEMLRGQTLGERLAQGRLPLQEALRIGVEVARGLAHAHSKGVVHRDLTPGNVYLCEDGQVKVLDLGMAHAFGRRKLDGGTPAYMAPEQRAGAPEDERTDVFALGVILYEVVAGERPFADERALASARAAPALEVPAEPALGDLVARMLAKDPLRRPRDAGEVLPALQAFAREVDRNPASGAGRVRKRPRLRFLALLAIAVLIGATGAAAGRWWVRSRPPGSPGPSVAVLPFADLSPQRDQDYFSDGLAEEIRGALARVEGLRVPGRTSSSSFRDRGGDIAEIARQLRVATVLEGSVRKEGNHVRVTAQLVSAADGYRLWADTFDRELTGVLAAQEEIAARVAGALKVKLRSDQAAGGQRGPDPRAYDQYLLARKLGERAATRRDWELAEAAFRKVVDLDPSFAPAWARLATVLSVRVHPEEPPEERRKAQARAMEAAEKAIAVAPGAPDGYSARGWLRRVFHYDQQGALADYERALALFPGDEITLRRYSGALLRLGRPAEAVAAARRAVEVEPVSAATWSNLAWALFCSGRVDLARSAVDRALEIAPRSYDAADLLALMELLEKRPAAVLAAAEKLPEENGEAALYQAAVQQTTGHPDADRTLQSFITRWGERDPYRVAELHAWRGDCDRAFEWLDRALATGEAGVDEVALDPLLRSLHGDPRWKPLLRKLNLPTP